MANAMTRKERLEAIFYGRVPDRPAVKVWGAAPGMTCIHPDYDVVRDVALLKTDLFVGRGSAFNVYSGIHSKNTSEQFTQPTDSPDWIDAVTILHTPAGDLRGVYLESTRHRPGYQKEYFLKEPEEIRTLLSLPYDPYPFDASGFRAAETNLGDTGLAYFGLDHPAYALQRMTGSERFALWSVEYPDLMMEVIERFAVRIRAHAEAAISAGIRGVFGYVGPELAIPPLVSPATFERFVFEVDKPLIDLIHDAGGRVWVHCHGKMRCVIGRFADMGIDVLNPIEPPPMGDVTMEQAFELAGDRMGLEGNIETHDIMTAPKDVLRSRIHETLAAGRGRRLILCPSAGFNENYPPSKREIENWLFFIDEGLRFAEEME